MATQLQERESWDPPIWRNLRRLKDEAGVTWRQVAQGVDAETRQVYVWAQPKGKYKPSPDSVAKLAAFFTERLGREITPASFYADPQ